MGLSFRDMTIDCSQDNLTDLRQEPASVRTDSCRVVGFGGAMIGARSLAFRARDCRITHLAPDAGFPGQARPLSDLNASWPAK